MRIPRYTGSGVAIQAAQEQRASVITAREAAGHELSLMRSTNRALDAVGRTATIFAWDASRRRQRQQFQRNQLTRQQAAVSLSNKYDQIMNDPQRFQKIAKDPTYYQKDIQEAMREARNQIQVIDDPFQRQMAERRLALHEMELQGKLSVWAENTEFDAFIQDTSALFTELANAGDLRGAAEAYISARDAGAPPSLLGKMENRMLEVEENNEVERLAEPLLDAFRTGGEEVGNAAAREFIENTNAPQEVVNKVMAAIAPAQMQARFAEEEERQQRAATEFMSSALIEYQAMHGIDPGPLDQLFMEATTTSKFGPPGSEEALAKAFQIRKVYESWQRQHEGQKADFSVMEEAFRNQEPYLGTLTPEMREHAAKLIDAAVDSFDTDDPEMVRNNLTYGFGVPRQEWVKQWNAGAMRRDWWAQSEEVVEHYIKGTSTLGSKLRMDGVSEDAKTMLETTKRLHQAGLSIPQAMDEAAADRWPENTVAREAIREEQGTQGYRDTRKERFQELVVGDTGITPFTRSGFLGAAGISVDDISTFGMRQIETYFNTVFDRAMLSGKGGAEWAASAALLKVQENVSVTNAGQVDEDQMTVIIGPGSGLLNGDVQEFNAGMRKYLRDKITAGDVTLPTPDGTFSTNPEDVDETDIEIVPVPTSDGKIEGDTVYFGLRANGKLVTKRVKTDDGMEYDEAVQLSMSRAELQEYMDARERIRAAGGDADDQQAHLNKLWKQHETLKWQIENPEDAFYAQGSPARQQARREEMVAKATAELHAVERSIVAAGKMLEASEERMRSKALVIEFEDEGPEESDTGVAFPEPQEAPPIGDYSKDDVRAIIRAEAKRQGVDPDLAEAVGAVESGFDPDARNPRSGAAGVMQVLPQNAFAGGLGYGADHVREGESLYDPKVNARVAVSYLRGLIKHSERSGKSVTTALQMYNWGPGNVNRWQASGGDPAAMPRETADYVEKVRAFMKGRGKSL